MPPTAVKDSKGDKDKTLKGKEAEDRVIGYLREMNRPFGAADVSANIKGVVSKLQTQKILIAAAEKGEITQKTYGKATYFVANQTDAQTLPQEQVQSITAQIAGISEEVKGLTNTAKCLFQEVTKIKSTPTDAELVATIERTQAEIKTTVAILGPLRSCANPVTEEELAKMDERWQFYRNQWIVRRKLFKEIWSTFTESMPAAEAEQLMEQLGLEYDSIEHEELEKSPFCSPLTNNRRRH